MTAASFFGVLGASSLVIGALLTFFLSPSRRVIGCIMAFGAGTMISAVTYELVLDALESGGGARVAAGLAVGALTFFLGDMAIDRRGGDNRKRSSGQQAEGSALAIFLGTLLDGVPESFILGLTVVTAGGVSVAFLAAVFISNLPESMAATYGLSRAGWSRRKLTAMWIGVALLAGASAALGFAIFGASPSAEGGAVQSFAAGALLTMLADTMMPEAFEFAGKAVGLLTVLGFGVAIALATLE